MSDSRRNWMDRISPLRRRGALGAAGAIVLLVILAWLVAPRRVSEVASVDASLRWAAREAPPRRSVVWRPAAQVEGLPQGSAVGEGVFHPHLADGGATLYFTLRKQGRADIHRARLEGGAWSAAEPVAAWNSEQDDLGPCLSGDGRVAYFCSNRPGGYGGFDLYASQWDGKAWSKPQNLGPRVNSPADEYDPALAPEGKRLFFASNRSAKMQQAAESGEPFQRGDPWNASLRAPRQTQPFNLYLAERAGLAQPWSAPRPLAEINLPSSSDGSPAVSPNGEFLYFASDRPVRSGEAPNFDLYRVRLRGLPGSAIENLGEGINTPLNELEPALSPEGFRLLFSRDHADSRARDYGGQPYAIYASAAVEVFDERGWDTSRWSALTGWLAEHGWWLGLGLLLAGLVAAMIWCLREISLRRAQVPVYFALALLVHLFLAAGSFFVGLDDDLLALVPSVREVIVAEQSFDEKTDEAKPPPEPFEQTEDLQNLESVDLGEAPRHESSGAAASPVTTSVRIASAAPLPANRLVYEAPPALRLPPDEPAPLQQAAILARRPAQLPEAMAAAPLEAVPMTPPSPAEPPEMAAGSELEMARSAVPPPAPPGASRLDVAPATVERRLSFDAEVMAKSAAATSPLPSSAPIAAPKRAALDVAAAETAPTIQAEQSLRGDVELTADATEQLRASVALYREVTAAPVAPQRIAKEITLSRAAPARLAERELAPERTGLSAALAPRSARFELARRSTDLREAEESLAEAPMAKAVAMSAESESAAASPAATTDVELAKGLPALPAAARRSSDTPPRMTGPRLAALERERPAETPPFDRPAAALARHRPDSSLLGPAEETIALEAMLQLRQSEAKADLLAAFGGSDETEAAVRRGVTWLERHQHPDGHWSLDRFAERCQEHHPDHKCSGAAGRASDTAATGFGLLPFLGAGHTHQQGEHQECVGRGLKWLVANQKENGDLFTGGGGNTHMYSHGIAAIALCEAYAMTKDPALREPAQRAIDFIAKAQHGPSGGWRYQPNQDGDTSVFGWQVMALKSGQIAGLSLPQATLDGAKKWLDRVGAKDARLGQFGYTNSGPSAAMTAEALLCVQYLGASRSDPRLVKGADYLLAHLPPTDTSYYWYYGTQVMFHLQGEPWRRWNEAQRDSLLKGQVKDGPAAGSWDPHDRWEKDGGRIYATSLRLLMLEVYYRHLPLYQALE